MSDWRWRTEITGSVGPVELEHATMLTALDHAFKCIRDHIRGQSESYEFTLKITRVSHPLWRLGRPDGTHTMYATRLEAINARDFEANERSKLFRNGCDIKEVT